MAGTDISTEIWQSNNGTSGGSRRKGSKMGNKKYKEILEASDAAEEIRDYAVKIWAEGYKKGEADASKGLEARQIKLKNEAYQQGYKEGVEYGRELQRSEDNERTAKEESGGTQGETSTGSRRGKSDAGSGKEERATMAEIGDVAAGTTVKIADMEWTVLDTAVSTGKGNETGVLVLAKEVLFEKAFDEKNNNNWANSTLREYLNGEFSEKIAGKTEEVPLIPFFRDLTSEDGLKDYGVCVDKMSLLSCDEYRKYREHIPNKNDWWWTLTPYSTPYASNSYSVRCVFTDGTLSGNNAYSGNIGVAPAFCVSSDFVVEVIE